MKKWIPIIIVIVLAAVIVLSNIFKGSRRDSQENVSGDSSNIKFKTNLYIENSGSMDGYVNGNTEFKDAIEHLLVMLNDAYGTPGISFINSQILPTGLSNDITQFSRQLTPNALHVGNTASSNINNIFKMILQKTDDKTVSVLVSDCVYSIKGSDASGLLAHEKNLTQDAFMNATKRSKNDLATIVLQCSSKFDGYYYDMNDSPIKYNGNRPYYIIFVGKTAYIKDLYSKIELDPEHIEGLTNSYIMSSREIDFDDSNASIITDDFTENINRIKPSRDELGIESLELEGDGKYAFAICFDAAYAFVDETYLKDKSNYSIVPSGAKIESIGVVDKNSSAFGDGETFKKPYYIQLGFDGKSHPSEITLSLKYNIPKWVYDCSTTNDAGLVPKANVTFGISYMIEGINEAFRVKNPAHSIFKIKFNIENYK